ncbi:MAG: hypothetical protein AVDCRST_MAG57-2988, partial [uncultured Blastococcus sp.]
CDTMTSGPSVPLLLVTSRRRPPLPRLLRCSPEGCASRSSAG